MSPAGGGSSGERFPSRKPPPLTLVLQTGAKTKEILNFLNFLEAKQNSREMWKQSLDPQARAEGPTVEGIVFVHQKMTRTTN